MRWGFWQTASAIRLTAILTLLMFLMAFTTKIARADLLQYSYTGSAFQVFYPTGLDAAQNPLIGSNVSATVVIDTGNGLTTYPIQSFVPQSLSITGGLTSYTGPNVPGIDGGTVQVNPDGQIVSWNLIGGGAATYGLLSNGFLSGFDSAGVVNSNGILINAMVTSVGTWSAPQIVGTSSPGSTGGSGSSDPTKPTSTACAADLKNAVHPFLSTDPRNLSSTGQPTDITATFKPTTGVTLAQAATDCNVAQFNWQQDITNLPTPSPFYRNSDGSNITAPPRINDPVEGGPTNPKSCNDGTISTLVNSSFPFYYAVSDNKTDCSSLNFPDRHYNSYTSTYSYPNSDELTFEDFPQDPCFFTGIATRACGLTNATGFEAFTTKLVGVSSQGELLPLDMYLSPGDDQFSWIDNYNGCYFSEEKLLCKGGIYTLSSDSGFADGLGSGGIELISVNGVDVPEPSSKLILLSAVGLLIFIKKFIIEYQRSYNIRKFN